MEKKILIRRISIQIDNSETYYTSAFNCKLMYTTQSATNLTRQKKIINMSQLMSLYKYIPTAEHSKTLFNKKDKITISYESEKNFFDSISITEKFFKKHTLTILFKYEPYDMTLKEIANIFDVDTALEIISDRIGAKVDKKILKEFL